MDLVGRKLGNYEIIDEIGRGGMAVVYRAYQRSLNRHVAIKVLAPQLSVDQQFVERFQREARAAAGLRHPHVVVIHDVAQEQGIYYIVMEYLEGRSLKELIQAEQSLSPERATRIVEQVASALDYAHEQGFVHRDIKPANIIVDKNDHVTLTDFGIAKAASETQHLTRTGMLIGTPEYMSPEQAEGGTVDHRTDLYALGVVLYQMLTGRAPFHSTTPHATLHAVIYEPPPPVRQLRPSLSPAIESVVMRSISKQPASRYQSGSDMVAALRAAQSGQSTVAVAAPPSTPAKDSRPQKSLAVPIAAGAAAVLVVIAIAIILLLTGDGRQQTPTPVAPSIATQGTAAVTKAVMITEAVPTDEPTTLPTHATTDTQPPPTEVLPQSTATSEPPTATSPPPTDTPAPPTDTPPPQPPAFGRLAFSSNRHGNPEIYVVDLAGGSPVRLTQNNANDWLPDWSADGTKITFTSYRTGSYDLWVMRADGSAQTSWVATGAWDDYPRWAPDGERISLSTTAETEGVPNSEIFVRRLNGSLQQVTYSVAEDQWADWSPDGRIIFTEGYKDGSDWDIYIIDADGSNRTTWLDATNCDVQPTWSPDGNWIAFLRITKDTNGSGSMDFEDAGDIWVGRATGGGLQQLTSGAWALTPTWSPDSEWVAFAQVRDSNNNGRSDQNDTVNIWAVPRSGGEAVPLVQSPNRDGDPSWTW